MSWTSPKTWAAGETVESSEMNTHLRDNLNYLYTQVITAPPFHVAQAYRNSSLSVANGARTLVTLVTGENIDTDGFHDTGTNPSRFTIPTALVPVGYTAIVSMTGYVVWAADSGGYRELRILVNGTTNPEATTPAATGTMGQHIALIRSVIAGDYLEMDAYQNSGGSINITGASASLLVLGIQPT